MRALAVGLALLLGAAGAAEARMHVPYKAHRIAAMVLPLDGGGNFATPGGAYSFRKLRSAYAGPAVKLRRVDTTTQDIGFLGFVPGLGAPIDVAAANAFCTTACTVQTWYDQSGNARDWLMATAASQPQYVANCLNGLPCARTLGGQNVGAAVPVTPAGAQSLSAVARSDTTNQGCTWISAAFQGIGANSSEPNAWRLTNNAGAVIDAVASPAVWHAAAAVVNGASSVVNLDGVETTGTVPVNTAATNLYGAYGGGGVAPCSEVEAVWWQGYALSAAERAALRANQRSFWGLP